MLQARLLPRNKNPSNAWGGSVVKAYLLWLFRPALRKEKDFSSVELSHGALPALTLKRKKNIGCPSADPISGWAVKFGGKDP